MDTKKQKKHRTSWNKVSRWYDKSVGKEGHYYHRKVVIPNLLRILDLESQPSPRLLDAACGQGILARQIPDHVDYVGVDIASDLLAKARSRTERARFLKSDICLPLPKKIGKFDHAVVILAMQNLERPGEALSSLSEVLSPGGRLVLVMNHPCFRIPKKTHWGVDKEKRIQYRRVERYMSSLEIPILTHPGQGEESEKTQSFHHPLSQYFSWLCETGFVVENLEEWCSDKVSEGGAAKMENRARREIPMFLALIARKKG